ncbi:MAG TPA: ABC transporter substrate-binding protein, partial [Candidatus Binatus sp.]|nr:ABC transporter substrate-binding protein [Candidatus Binatus sp.]
MKCSHNFSSPLPNRRSRLAVALVLLLVTLVPPRSWGQALKKVPFPFSPIGINVLPWLVAKEVHIAERHGIDFDPVFIGASAVLVQSMLSGAADFSGSGGPAIIANVLKGGDIIHITSMVPRFTQSIMVKPEIKRPEDLVGKKVGVSRLGTVTHFALQTAMDGYGVKNVTILQMGGQPEE